MFRHKKIIGLFFAFMSAFAEAPSFDLKNTSFSESSSASDTQSETDFLTIPVTSKKKSRFKRGFFIGTAGGVLSAFYLCIASAFQGFTFFLSAFLTSPLVVVGFGLYIGILNWFKHKVYDYVDPEEAFLVINKKDLVIDSSGK